MPLYAESGAPVPHIFQSGSKAKASEVNTNFQDLADRVATVAVSAGTAAVTYDFRDYLPTGDLLMLFSKEIGGDDGVIFSVSSEWLSEGSNERLHLTEGYQSPTTESRTLKVFGVEAEKGLRLLERRNYSVYGENNWLQSTVNWELPLESLPAQLYSGQGWVVEGMCTIIDNTGTSEQCYTLKKRTFLGVESVMTPVGNFDGSLRILDEYPGGMKLSWYAPGMGLVKRVVSQKVYENNSLRTQKTVWLLSSYSSQNSNLITTTGSVLLAPNFLDSSEITKVVYYQGSVSPSNLLVTKEGGSYYHLLDYNAADNGSHSYTIQAYNALNEVVSTLQRTVEVAINSDHTAPTLSLVATPSSITETTSSELSVTTNDADIARIELLQVGEVIATDLAAPYSFDLDYDSLDNGSHSFTARATDLNGNSAESNAVSVTVNMQSPTAASTAVGKARALVNEIRALVNDDNSQGIGLLNNPGELFSNEIALSEQLASAMADHHTANLGRVVEMVVGHYLGDTVPEIIGNTYDLSHAGSSGSGSISTTTVNGHVTYSVLGVVNQDDVSLVLTLPEYGGVAGPFLMINLSGWVGLDATHDRMQLDGQAVVELRQRIRMDESTRKPSKSADLYIAGLELELGINLNQQRSGKSDLNYQGEIYLGGVLTLLNKMNSYSWSDGNQTHWSHYYEPTVDLLPTTIQIEGAVSDDSSTVMLKAKAELNSDWRSSEEERIRHLALSFGAKLGLLPTGRVDLQLRRLVEAQNDVMLTATIAYDTVTTEVVITGADLDEDNEHLVLPIIVRSQDGVEIRLTENEDTLAVTGILTVNGASVGTITEESSGAVRVEYTDNSSELF
jgi:hypothetical protein